jgi:hypothetical protein
MLVCLLLLHLLPPLLVEATAGKDIMNLFLWTFYSNWKRFARGVELGLLFCYIKIVTIHGVFVL